MEQSISKVAKTEEARSSLRDLIASITAEEPAATKLVPAATQQTPTKSLATPIRVSSKHKGAQTSEGSIAPEELEHKRTRPTQPKPTTLVGTPPISPTPSQKKKQLRAIPKGSPKERLRNATKKK